MPNVKDILKASGMDDAAIANLDAKIVSSFETVLTTAAQERETAELASRAQQDMYSNQIAPALDGWANEKARLEAENAFYKTQAENARSSGFIPKDAPGYQAPAAAPGTRTPDGRYVAGGNAVPGSPQYMTRQEGLSAVTNASYIINEHMRLHGTPLPDDIETLLNESAQQHMDFRPYVEKKYNFAAKRQEIQTAAETKRIDAAVAEKMQVRERELAERYGNNPMVRSASPSSFAEVRKAVTEGKQKDPLTMSREERRAQTSQMIQRDIQENASSQVN